MNNNARIKHPRTVESIKLFSDVFSSLNMEEYLENITRRYAAIGESEYYGGKHCGSDAEHEGSRFIYDELKKLGIKVEMIPFRTSRFQFNDASISFEDEVLKPYACMTYPTGKEGVTAKVVEGGSGDRAFFQKNNVKGKIVILETDEEMEDGTTLTTLQMYEAQKNGAAALILYTRNNVVNGKTVRATPSNFRINIPVVSVGYDDADLMIYRAKKDKNFEINLKVDTEFAPDGGETYEVIGEIPGETDERIIYTAHLDHFFRCVQDNITAVATCLGIAKAIKASGYKPKRTINFVFNGSHEVGRIDSATPDLQGAWEFLEHIHPEWVGKIIADINFEYTGMEMNLLRGMASYEGIGSYLDFLRYMPDTMPGYSGINTKFEAEPLEMQAVLCWCDACPFIMKGITCFGNDAVSEQMIEPPTSPYVGRDHSNHDDFSIYSNVAHATNTEWFGALGMYLDSKPLMEPDYSYRARGMAFMEEEQMILEVEDELDLTEYQRQYENFKEKGKKLTKALQRYNDMNDTGQQGNASDDKYLEINAAIMHAQKLLADGTEGLYTTTPTMIMIPHHIYMEKDGAFLQAFDMMETEKKNMKGFGKTLKVFKKAYDNFLSPLDMVGMCDKFSKEMITKIKDCILTENVTWNKDKCKSVYLKEDVGLLKIKKTYEHNYAILVRVFEEETECLKKVNGLFDEIINMM